MRATTQVPPAHGTVLGLHVVVDGEFGSPHLHDLRAAFTADESQLEWLAGELVLGLGFGHHATVESLARLDDLLHALLESLQIIRGEGGGHREVVVEAVLDRRPDAELRVREGVLDRLGEDVGGRMTQHGEPLGRVDSHGLDDVALAQRGGEVA